MRISAPAVLFVVLMVGGCAANSPTLDNIVLVPSHFDTLDCPGLAVRHQQASTRTKELTALMEKSGNPFINGIAYNSEYATNTAVQRYAEEAARKKGCDLSKKP